MKTNDERNNRELLESDKTLKPYKKPILEELGDLRALTLGPSPGVGESGNPLVFLGN